MTAQRRTFPRLRSRIKLEMEGLVCGYTIDISAGGFQAEHYQPLSRTSTIVGRLIALECRFDFTGRLTWAIAGVPSARITSRSGIQLSGIDPAFYSWLMTLSSSDRANLIADGKD